MKTKQMFVGLGAVAALGAAIVPMASYAADSSSSDVAVSLRVGSTISMALDSNTINEEVLSGGSSTSKTTVATVSTNSATGYTIAATPNPATGALTSTEGNTIAYVGTGYSTATEGWALSVGGTYKDLDTDSGTSTEGTIPLFRSDSPASSVGTTINYNFKTDASTPSGDYQATLEYTAAVK